MVPKEALSAADVLKLIGDDDLTPLVRVPKALHNGYLRAAAVLTAIGDIGSLKPVLGLREYTRTDIAAADALRDDLILTSGRRFDGAVMLSPEARRNTLATFHSQDEIAAALDANRSERKSDLQKHFESYLLAKAKPLMQQSSEELEQTLQVALWVEGLQFEGVPSTNEVRQLVELKRLLAPFETLAGGDRFRGRAREIDILRSFVGVLPPESLLRRLGSRLQEWLLPKERAALSVYGPGGVGKSALIAKFMLEHTQVREDIKIPFAYLDFDRPALDISDPLSLLVEALRQLSLQFPEGRPYEKLLEFGESLYRRSAGSGNTDRHSVAHGLFADILGTLQTKLGPRPYVVVLDTFEEIQYRGETRASPLWQLLAEMQKRWPFLRVIISGRAPVSSLFLAGTKPESLELGGLDKESALAILVADGVDDEVLAGKLVDQVGAVPLSLKLVGEMFKRDMIKNGGIKNLKSSFWMTASAEYIQGQLYERILGHIHEEQVRRLAHPGLVLRRITPEVILHVLNEPCSLGISTMKEAEALCRKLEQETSLVSRDDSEGALVHRADLRRLMLGLLQQKEPGRVKAIHQKAVEYYGRQQDLRSRAECLYHRAALGETLSNHDVEDPEVRSSLQSSISELPLATQAQLAAFGLQVSKEILESTSREQHDAYLQSQIEEAFPYGTSALPQINSLMGEIEDRLDRPTPLFRTAARVHRYKRDEKKALALIEAGLSQAALAGRSTLMTELLAEQAWALRGKAKTLVPVLDTFCEYARREGNPVHILQEQLQRQEDPATANGPKAVDGLDAIAMQLHALTGAQLWELVPAFEKVMHPLADRHVEAMVRIADLITAEDSPFGSTRFPTREVNDELSTLIDKAYSLDSDPSKENAMLLAVAFGALCKVWPYYILQVRAPYFGQNRSRLSRSA